MFGISFETWTSVCQMYCDLEDRRKSSYLQWFPFSKLRKNDYEKLTSREFFEKYIQTGAFVISRAMMHQSENYLQKGDGSFRDSTLLSPILYLVLQSIGKEISNKYKIQRESEIEVYYAGNYNYMRPIYKQDYDDFYKSINFNIQKYQYFIKTDVSNFFSNINVDLLIKKIDCICNKETIGFTQSQLMIFKEFLLYCGGGRFPLVENSVASSFLATIVYLDDIDI